MELAAPLAVATGPPVLYSTLETQTISSTDRRVVHVTTTRIEAPNWLRDGSALVYNSGGRIFRAARDRRDAASHRHRLRHALQQRPRRLTGWNPAGDQRPVAGTRGSRSSIRCRSRAERPSSSRSRARRTGTAGRRTARCWPFAGSAAASSTSIPSPPRGGQETRLTTAPGLDDGPEYSPDGKFIYFNSVRTGTMQIWRMKTDGSEQEPVTADEFNNWFPHVSPNGRSMVFLSYEKDVTGHPENKDVTLRIMSLESKKIDVLGRFFGGQGTINVPCWSPDGRKIAFVTYQLVPRNGQVVTGSQDGANIHGSTQSLPNVGPA